MIERTARIAAPATVALFAVFGVLLAETRPLVLAAGALAVVVAVGLAARGVVGWPLVVGLLVISGLFMVVCTGQPSNLGWFGLCVLAGWAAVLEPVRRALVVAGAAVAGLIVQWLALADEPGWGAWIAGTLFTTIAGSLGRNQRLLLDQLREAQAGLADRARAEERNRIAHELHDVIGHALTVSLLHVSSARLAVAEDPAEAEESLRQAERLAQQSLADVRAVVGLMKDPGSSAPLPGIGEIDELVESFRRAGTDVTCEVVGDLSRLSATEGLTVYRILQEALTNVARHAPGSPAVVRLEVGVGQTRVQVDSTGSPGRETASGVGLTGMRERAEVLGGAVTAGPWGSGWRVEAVLPG